jgi:Right handed beta helix region
MRARTTLAVVVALSLLVSLGALTAIALPSVREGGAGPTTYSLEFDESGLAGANWSVTLFTSSGSSTLASSGASIVFEEPHGSYAYTVEGPAGYAVTPSSGSATVAGGVPALVSVSFNPVATPTYAVGFNQSGLSGLSWSVTVTGAGGSSTLSSTGTWIVFEEPNGGYTYSVTPPTGYTATPSSGSGMVASHNPPSVAVRFAKPIVATATIGFSESGLSGQAWSVTLTSAAGSSTLSSVGTSISFQEPNGSYDYSVTPPAGFSAKPSTGVVTVSGPSPVSVTVPFVATTATTYTVGFNQTGLSGPSWSVTLTTSAGSSTQSATGAWITFSEPNGSYSYTVSTPTGYTATPSSGSGTVAGHNPASVAVRFSAIAAAKYSVGFTASGLSGQSWGVTLTTSADSSTQSSTGTWITFSEPNGSYSYTVSAPSGYTATPSSGSGTIAGHNPASVGVTFSTTSSTLTIPGNWIISTWVNESNVAITVNGNVTVESGGHLYLSNSTLVIDEPLALARGVEVYSGGSFTSTGLTLESNPSSLHTFLQASSGAVLHLAGGVIRDIGGPVGGKQGLFVQAAGATISGVTIDQYYQALQVDNAVGVQVTGATILNSTSTSNQTFAIQVFGSSSGFVLSGSTLRIPQDVGALWIASPDAQVTHNTFTLDPGGAMLSALYFGYAANGAQRADGSSFSENTVTGSGFIDEIGSNVTISGNSIHDTGPNRPYGILAEVPLWTEKGLWVRNLVISGNTISDYSRYGIRLQQNVTDFTISGNTIVQPSAHPSPPWTVIWGGPQIDALYLIRGVLSGSVVDNTIDDSDASNVATDGITLESDVSYVKVEDNRFYNVSQEGVVLQGNVPGFDNAEPWQDAPSDYDVIANNLFDNERAVTQTNFTVAAILLWQWANHTTVVNNTFIGWQNVPTKYWFNGAIVLTTASYGFYWNNTVIGARYGFVFSNFTGVAHPYPGEFNRSDNLVYGNMLSGITVAAVSETPHDGMGPLHNVIVVLSNTASGAGVPTSYVESIGPATDLSGQEGGGTYTESLTTRSPITGTVQPFATVLPWSTSSFAVTAAGGVGSGALALAVASLSSTSVGFSVSAASSETITVNLYPTALAYIGVYLVTETVNGVTTKLSVSAGGPVSFTVAGGTNSIVVQLVSFSLG